MDRFAKYLSISGALRNAQCDLELVTRLHLNDGTTQEITNTRRVVCKKVTRRRASTLYSFADVDLVALDQIFPFESFTVEDWPNLFVDDVGKRVPHGVGTARKVPFVWIDTNGLTSWTYAGPKVLDQAGTVLTVYRGSTPGQGAIVDPSEYVVSTATAPSGYTVHTLVFTREQIDFGGRPYVIEADMSLPGARTPSDEIKRVLEAFGLSTGAASFTQAIGNDTTAGFFVDALYGGAGRTGRAIIADLCDAARGWLTPGSSGAWEIVQDVAKASSAQFDTSCDLIDIDEYGDADVPAKVTLFYRPKASLGEEWSTPLSRATSGASGEMQRHNPYIYEHDVADRYLCYWQKRLNATIGPNGGIAKATVHAAQIASGARITVTDAVAYVGTKDFIAPGVARPADANQLTLREYDSDVYVYTAGTLPSDATNGYSPDYTYTPPAAPTSLAYTSGSSGTSTDADGKVRSYAYVSCTVPAANWKKITFQVTDTTTGEIYQAQGAISGTTASATIANLPPNRAMQVRAWATNANNIDGSVAGPVSFTSATTSAVPSTPTLSVTQTHSLQLEYSWTASTTTGAKVKEYVLELRSGGGAYVEKFRGLALKAPVPGLTTSTSYDARVKAVDAVGNESAYSSLATMAPAKMITDDYIVSQGVSGGSIADGSINQGRGYTGTGTLSTSIGAGAKLFPSLDVYTFFPNIYGDRNTSVVATSGFAILTDKAEFTLWNQGAATENITLTWRKFNP